MRPNEIWRLGMYQKVLCFGYFGINPGDLGNERHLESNFISLELYLSLTCQVTNARTISCNSANIIHKKAFVLSPDMLLAYLNKREHLRIKLTYSQRAGLAFASRNTAFLGEACWPSRLRSSN